MGQRQSEAEPEVPLPQVLEYSKSNTLQGLFEEKARYENNEKDEPAS